MKISDTLFVSRLAMSVTAHLPRRDTGHVVVVTSARPREGKSFVSDLLARGLSRTLQTRVALIDSHGGSEGDDGDGIAGMIRRGGPPAQTGSEDTLIPANDARVLRVAAGVGIRTALFHSEGVLRTVRGLQQRFRLSLIDSPVLADCGALLLHADAVVLVVDSERTDPAIVRRAMADATIDASRFVGVVLNQAPKFASSRWRAGP